MRNFNSNFKDNKVMNRQDIVKQVAKNCGITKVKADEAVATTLNMVKKAINNKEIIVLRGFGTFKAKETEARMARNPKTGEAVYVPAGLKVKFKALNGFLNS